MTIRSDPESYYSRVAVAKRARDVMSDGGSTVTPTYYGAEKVVPHCNVIGRAKAALETTVQYLANDLGPEKIRVNVISAGPIKTQATSGIGMKQEIRRILRWAKNAEIVFLRFASRPRLRRSHPQEPQVAHE